MNKKTFITDSNLEALPNRPDKDVFIDTVVLGLIITKKVNLEKYKTLIKKHIYTYFPRSAYIKVYKANLVKSGSNNHDDLNSLNPD